MKKIFSKRWLGNFLIVLFGVVILIIVGLVSYRLFFTSASTTATRPTYSIGGNTLYIYYPNAISDAFSSVTGANPADPFAKILIYNDPTYGATRYVSLPIAGNNYVDGWNSQNDPSYKLLTYAYTQAQLNNSSDISIINTAIYNYRQAIIFSGTNYRLANNTLYVHDSYFESIYNNLKANGGGDQDVSVANSFPTSNLAGTNLWSLSVAIGSGITYKNPLQQSTALNLLNSALSSATNAETSDNALLKESSAPSGLAKINFTKDKTDIQAAINNYTKQISSNASSGGITISSVDTVDFKSLITINFSADYTKIVSGSNNIQKFSISVNNSTIGSFDPTVDVNLSGDNPITWNSHQKSGSYILGPNSGDPAKQISTTFPGSKTFTFAAFDQNNKLITNANKTITVLPGIGTDTTPTSNGSVPMSVTIPQSVDLSNKAVAASVPIKISASNLNPNNLTNTTGPGRVGKISWYVCSGSQPTIQANDSAGCEEKGSFGPFVQNSFTDKVVNWDASGSAPGTYIVMLKAFALKTNASDTTYPPYPGAEKVVSPNLSVVADMTGGTASGGGSDGGGSITPGWAANFQKSSAKTIDDILKIIGSFTLYILGFLAVIAIIIAGMKYITSGGDPKGAETGKKSLLFAIYGIVAAVLCVMLVKTTISEVQGIIGNSLQAPAPGETGTILSTQFGGPNASVLDIIGQDSGLIWRIIQLLVYYAEVVAVFYILYASFLYLTAYGDDSKAESAKKTIIWAVIGMAFILSANVLINIFGQVLK